MNVKSLTANLNSIDRTKTPEANSTAVKMESSSKDRDANGQRDPEPENQKEFLNDEEMEQALEKLRELDGIKNNNLVILLAESGEKRVVLVKDLEGKVVRRIPEAELWPLIQESFKEKGHLIDKTG